MEGVSGRLGRTTTRYGPATVFIGPVRKWKRKWVHVASPYSATAAVNGGNGSPLKLRKWTPVTQSAVNGDGEPVSPSVEPPSRKFKYVPIALLVEQKLDAPRMDSDEEAIADADDVSLAKDEEPDTGGVRVDRNEEDTNKVVRQDLNESTGDLGLDLNGCDGGIEPDPEGTDRIV